MQWRKLHLQHPDHMDGLVAAQLLFLRSLGFQSTFFSPAFRTCSFTAAKWSFTSCIGEQDSLAWISHARGFNPCWISFSGFTIIIHHNLLVPGFLKLNTTTYHQLLSNWGETPCLRWKKTIFSVKEDSKIMFYVKPKHPSWLLHHKFYFLLLESKSLIVSNYYFLTLKPIQLYSLSGISV